MNVDFVPHAPASEVDASVIAVRSHTVMGQYQVVALNRGTGAGLEPGHILAVYQLGDRCETRSRKAASPRVVHVALLSGNNVQLPDERAGIIMVFKAFDKVELCAGDGNHARNSPGRPR